MTLPELSVIDTHLPSNTKIRGYTVEQMLAWGKANAEQEREACAKAAEKLGVYPELNVYNGGPDWYKHGKAIATALRARGNT